MTAKEKLHLVVEELSEAEAEEALRLLAARRSRGDALLELLEGAREDDEAADVEEDAGVRDAWADYRRGDSMPLEQVRKRP